MLEAILRQFEYEADLLAAHGQHGIDTDWLRQELDMADDPVEKFRLYAHEKNMYAA